MCKREVNCQRGTENREKIGDGWKEYVGMNKKHSLVRSILNSFKLLIQMVLRNLLIFFRT